MEQPRPQVGQPGPVPPHLLLTPTYHQADLDEARTLLRLVEFLPDLQRLEWLAWCCEKASVGEPMNFRLGRKPQDLKEYMWNLWQMIGHGELTVAAAVQGAEAMARKVTF